MSGDYSVTHVSRPNRFMVQQSLAPDVLAFGGSAAEPACATDSVIEQWHAALSQMKPDTNRFPDIGHIIEEYKGPQMASST